MKHTTTEVKLKTGASGLFVNIPHASVMTFEINFRAGEYLVLPHKWEVPHLMEHMVLGGNELFPRSRDFQAELEKNGAYSNASTSVYDITYEAECADFEWDRVLGLLLTSISRPLFSESEFKAEFGNVQEELAARANNHYRRLGLEMRAALGMLVKTDAERLQLMDNINVNDVKHHHQLTHFSPNLRFVIAGDLSANRRQTIIKMLENLELPTEGKRFELPHEKPLNLEQPVYVRNDTVENLYFSIDTFMRRRLTDPEADALNLVNTMLTETLYSKILGTARERGLVYDMNAGLSQTRDAGNWWFGAQVSDKNIKPLLAIMVEELGKVMAGDLDDVEIAAAKQYSLGRFQRSAQTVIGTASGYSDRYFFDGVIDNYYEIPKRIAAINRRQIVEVAQAMFADNVWGIGVLGDCGPGFANELRQQIAPLWAQSKQPSKG